MSNLLRQILPILIILLHIDDIFHRIHDACAHFALWNYPTITKLTGVKPLENHYKAIGLEQS